MTLQQIKTILGYLLISVIFFLIASHPLWPAEDYSFYVAVIVFILFAIYYMIDKVKETTLCFIVKDNKVLMMHRNKKKKDVHKNKYNGLGGRVERGESKKDCLLREVKEEAGVILTNYNYVGKVRFKDFGYKKGQQIMYCYVAYDYQNEIGDCNEGDLHWIDKDQVLNLPLWEGDQYFIMNIINNIKFDGYIEYKGDQVVNHKFRVQNKEKNQN